jgi:hypothetical protein
MGATQTKYDAITTSNTSAVADIPDVTDDITTANAVSVADIPDVTDVITTSHSELVADIVDATEQLLEDAPGYPTQTNPVATEQLIEDAIGYPTQTNITATDQLKYELSEPSFARAGGSNAAKLIGQGLL